MKINSKEERFNYLKENITDIGSYALVTYNNETYPIWITAFWNWDKDGDWFLEAPCEGRRYEFKDTSDKAIREFVKEQYEEEYIEEGIKYVKSMIRDGYLYEIDSPQVAPFLPDKLDDLILISEEECLEWMLNRLIIT